MLFDIPTNKRSIIKVLGVGGGGGNAVEYMHSQGIEGVDFAICNTDAQVMNDSVIPVKIHLGPALTEGRGAGAKPAIGKQACLESVEEVRKFLDDGTKMLFITAGMGGGTGTGAAPVIAKIAKELDILTVAIVTLPFRFEGMNRHKLALEGLAELKAQVDAILVIENEKLKAVYGDLKLGEAFAKADSVLNTAAKGIAEIITLRGVINVDFEDVNTTMRESGVALMGSCKADGESRAKRAVEGALNSPLLKDNDIRGSQKILLNITSSVEHESTMDEIAEITEYIQEEAGYGTNIIFGHGHDKSLGENISVTLIATGFDEFKDKEEEIEAAPAPIKVPLEDKDDLSNMDGFSIGHTSGESSTTIDFEDERTPSPIPPTIETTPAPAPRRVEQVQVETRRETFNPVRGESMQIKTQDILDDPEALKHIEEIPAYKRKQIALDEVQHSSENQVSRYTVSIDEDDNPVIKSNNSFLHDNVD